jgi:hypothetical protein
MIKVSPVPRAELREKVRDAYPAVAANPAAPHVFAVGCEFAASLGYPEGLLRGRPPAAVDAITGVSSVSVFAGSLPA